MMKRQFNYESEKGQAPLELPRYRRTAQVNRGRSSKDDLLPTGQAFVETVIIVPILALLIVGIVQFSQISITQQRLLMAARHGVWLMGRGQPTSVVEKEIKNFLVQGNPKFIEKRIEIGYSMRDVDTSLLDLQQRLEAAKKRLEAAKKRYDPAKKRFDEAEKRYDEAEKRLEILKRRLSALERELAALERKLKAAKAKKPPDTKAIGGIKAQIEVVKAEINEVKKGIFEEEIAMEIARKDMERAAKDMERATRDINTAAKDIGGAEEELKKRLGKPWPDNFDTVRVSYELHPSPLLRPILGEKIVLQEHCVVAGGTWYWGVPGW